MIQVLVANRSQMETSLTFCGFMAMENKLKAETSGVLLQLAKAGLREVMVTGDNPLTAISVSRFPTKLPLAREFVSSVFVMFFE